MIRILILLAALAPLLADEIVAPAKAEPPSVGSGNLTIGPNFVETVVRCDSSSHYVPLRRALNGQWVKGHCERNQAGAPARPAQ